MATATGTIVQISDYSSDTLDRYLKNISEVPRKIAIGFKNYTGYTLESLNAHFERGKADRDVPPRIPGQYVGTFSAPQSQSTARETAGVFSYYIKEANKTVHVLWVVPYDQSSNSNWWNVDVVNESEKPSHSVYDRLYSGPPDRKAPGQYFNRPINGFKVGGRMTKNGKDPVEATLEVELNEL